MAETKEEEEKKVVSKIAEISQLIAVISPELYSGYNPKNSKGKEKIKEIKRLTKEGGAYYALKKVKEDSDFKPQAAQYVFSFPESLDSATPAKGGMNADYTIAYDSSSETLEPIYFWLLDLMRDMSLSPEKLIDNFSSSPGSGHFGELQGRASIMQQQGSKLMADIGMLMRSILNIIYDLRDFKIRLKSYDDLKSDKKEVSNGARLSLKQIWMDKVDVQRGNSSIKGMALGQAGFVTLLDAFLLAEDEKSAEALDLNDRVKRIVVQRIQEFNSWLKESEYELRKRYSLEKNYLRSQVNSLKLYSRWAKPYLKAASEMEQKEQGRSADFVKTFNTIILELTLLGKSGLDPKSLAISGAFPKYFKDYKGRKYYSVILIDFKFRGIPQRVSGGQSSHYAFGGRVEIHFRAYALNDDELKMLNQELEKSDIGDVLKLIEGTTTESLDQIQKDIDDFLNEKEEEVGKKEEKKSSDINPFMALLGKTEKKEEKKSDAPKKKEEIKEIKEDDWKEENFLRPLAEAKATETLFALYDIYKKGHGMPSFA